MTDGSLEEKIDGLRDELKADLRSRITNEEIEGLFLRVKVVEDNLNDAVRAIADRLDVLSDLRQDDIKRINELEQKLTDNALM